MRTLTILTMVAAIGCGRGGHGGAADGGALMDVPIGSRCPAGQDVKIKFSRELSCANDGSVEFCIPSGNAPVQGKVLAISSLITCAPGGGRAGCLRSPGLLLCSYPTTFPGQCLEPHGEMIPEIWSDMCELAALPEVVEIVPTILE